MGYIGAGISRFNTADELTVTGDAEFNGNANFGDSDKAQFGAGNDLQIYHDGSNSYIDDAGTGKLFTRSSQFQVQKYTGENMIVAVADDRVDLYYDNNKKLETTSTGVSITGGGTFSSSSSGEFNALTISQAHNTSGNESRIRFKRTTDAGSDREVAAIVADRLGGNDTDLVFETNTDGSDGATERVRIGHSGDVYIGKTSEALATAGSQFRSSGQALDITRDGGSPLNVNRLSSSGELVGFFQDTAQFGQITCFTTNNTDYLQVGSSGSSKAGVVFETNRIYPTVAGSASNGTVDLGTSSVRFKDGYFSNYLYANLFAGVGDTNTLIEFPGSNVMKFVTNGGEKLRILSDGRIGKGTTSAIDGGDTSLLYNSNNGPGYVISSTDATGNLHHQVKFIRNGSHVGNISTSGSATAYNTSSDRRLKSNIEDAASASDKIDAIQVRQFDWNLDGSHQDYGLIAQELQAIEPLAVSAVTNSDEMMGVDYSKLVPMLIKEIQELRSRVAALEE